MRTSDPIDWGPVPEWYKDKVRYELTRLSYITGGHYVADSKLWWAAANEVWQLETARWLDA